MSKNIDSDRLISYLADLKKKINELEARLQNQEQRLGQLERSGVNLQNIMEEKQPPPEISPELQSVPASPIPEEPEIALSSKEVSASDSRETDLEQKIGGKWFARIGITALILGIDFF